MKKIVLVLSVVVCFAFHKSYSQVKSSSPSSPSDAATKFTKAMLSLNIKEAEKYMTKSGVAIMNQAAPMIEKQAASLPDSIKALLNKAKVTTKNEKINGDSAKVDVTTMLEKEMMGTKEETKTLSLAKENGQWKVLFDLGGDASSDENPSKVDSTKNGQ